LYLCEMIIADAGENWKRSPIYPIISQLTHRHVLAVWVTKPVR